jgi:glycosyltransferase involved in cell wall biosynthesis
MSKPTLALVVPCYNEEEIIVSTIETLLELLDRLSKSNLISNESFIVLVDDGSKDKTVELALQSKSKSVIILKLANNVGHQHALLAGLHYVTNKVDCCVSIDADLQDDIKVINQMVSFYLAGAHIVYGIRDDRKSDSLFKKSTATLFYQLMMKMGVPLIYNHADFRLISNTVLQELGKYQEVNLFLRGLFPQMGYPSAQVFYSRKKRMAGESKYPFFKMLKLAVNGITSFTNYPLKIITVLGTLIFVSSIIATLWILVVVIQGRNVPGWASITLPIYFLGGIQLLAIGILGEYISRIYLETKRRPLYHIEKVIKQTY